MNTATTYLNRINITLEPIWHDEPPVVRVGIDNELQEMELRETMTFMLDFDATAENYNLIVEFINKKDGDTRGNLDKAVVIKNIEIFGISDPRFIWQGVYEPKYPKAWLKEQKKLKKAPPPLLKNHTYLGWNGVWRMKFSVPIFTWVHSVQNLGWIYS